MHYITFDLEFNQDFSSLQANAEKLSSYPFEIIQIGALKLDSTFHTVASFDRYVKPEIYSNISSLVSELTGITTEQLYNEMPFSAVFEDFMDFIGEPDNVFCVWGMSDMKEIYKNADYYKLVKKRIPTKYINIQPYVSTYLGLPVAKLLNLQIAVDALHIHKPYSFHNALNDAYYTAEIFHKLHSPFIIPQHYDPNFIRVRTRQPKKIIDFDSLIRQFMKMYDRELTAEETEMIKLAYKMGKTNQFIKYE